VITSHSRGHEIVFVNDQWLYSDTMETCGDSRPCVRCGRLPNPDGSDACVENHIEGAVSVCCGHGIDDKILIMDMESE
jgi:hypothetical protein